MIRLATLSLLLAFPALLQADEKDEKKNAQPNAARAIQIQVNGAQIQARPAIGVLKSRAYSGMNKIYLVRRPDVQKDLELDEDQQIEIKEAIEGMTKSRQDMFAQLRGLPTAERIKKSQELQKKMAEDSEKKIEGILEPKQFARLDEIAIQLQGVNALNDPRVIKKLEITEEQQKKFELVREESNQKRTQLVQEMRNGNLDRTKYVKKVQEITANIEKGTLEVLTKEQRAEFDKMKGKKFETANARGNAGVIRGQVLPIRRIQVQPRRANVPQDREEKADK